MDKIEHTKLNQTFYYPLYLTNETVWGIECSLDAQLDVLFNQLMPPERIMLRLVRSATQQRARVYGPGPLASLL